MVGIIDLLLDNQLGYCYCTGVPQARVVYPRFQDRTNRSQRQRFSGRDSFNPWGFKVHPLNLNRGHSGADCRYHMNLECNTGHNGDDCGHMHWDFLWHKDCMFRG